MSSWSADNVLGDAMTQKEAQALAARRTVSHHRGGVAGAGQRGSKYIPAGDVERIVHFLRQRHRRRSSLIELPFFLALLVTTLLVVFLGLDIRKANFTRAALAEVLLDQEVPLGHCAPICCLISPPFPLPSLSTIVAV